MRTNGKIHHQLTRYLLMLKPWLGYHHNLDVICTNCKSRVVCTYTILLKIIFAIYLYLTKVKMLDCEELCR